MRTPLAGTTCLVVAAALASACGTPPPGETFFDRNIQPILTQSCARNTGGCHKVDTSNDFGFAAGNFDVTSYENVQKRRDLLAPFGAYSVPPLLIKAAGPGNLQVAYNDKFLDLVVQHTGGANLAVGSDAYLTLLTWLENGATENGLAPPTPPKTGNGMCTSALPPGFDPTPYKANASFASFKSTVEPIFEQNGCNSGDCHGAPAADFYIACGGDDDHIAFNFSQAWAFVANPVDDSQLLRVPLAHGAGGGPHTGGDQFASRDDDKYVAIKTWATAVGPLVFGQGDAGKQFFADNVQPLLITRGCSFPACHSPEAANDLKLRSGSLGFFSAIALEKNYELLKNQFMALEYPDARRGRAVAKGILPSFGGIPHRGGGVLETPGGGVPSDPAACPQPYDPATATAFCTIQQWLTIERQPLLASGDVLPLGNGDTVPIVYVDRAETHVYTPLDADLYQGGSDLKVATAHLGADSAITSVDAGTSLLGNCAGVDPATADVRAPDVRYDGTRVVFALRTSSTDRLGIWAVDIDGQNCTRITAAQPDKNGLPIHDFDPAWSPDGTYIVFASTRGGAGGPTRSRKLFKPQSDLWRMHEDGSGLEQMTFLTNSEIQPQFMREGRTTMTTEKVSDGFYQLSGRRQNWDLTDYHPLVGQRDESPYADPTDLTKTLPSIGYQQVTDIREAADGNFLLTLSDAGAKGGAGTLGIFNRSVGPFEADRTDPGFLKSLTILDPAATGRVGSATNGAYKNPFDLPDGRIMVSYTTYSGDLANATSLDWDVIAIDPITGAKQTLIGGAGAQVEAVLAIKHPPRDPYLNHRQLVFGGSLNPSLGSDAVVHMPDAPMVFTVLTGNLRRGRPVDAFRKATKLVVWKENPPPAGTTAGNQSDGRYENRTKVGEANLESDGSVKVQVPSSTGVILELQDASGHTVVKMGEEHQLGPGEQITMGVVESLFDSVCGGCHGSVSGKELDVHVTPDALTGASQSISAGKDPIKL